jgi:glucose/arabinose dehydrogenase
METYASGIRHVGAMTVHPFTKRIWFTDQSRNKMGQSLPTSEVNILEEKADYGFPYVHGAGTKDPHFGVPMIGQKFTAPVADVRPHAQPTGIVFSNTQCFLLVTRGSQEEGASAEGRVEEFCPQGKGFTSRTLVTAGADNRLTDIIPYEKGWLISDDKQNMIWELRKK